MTWNGAGAFNRLYRWVDDAAAAINITSTRMDAEFDNVDGGLENCVTRDGQNSPSANLPMATFKHTAVGNAAARDQYAAMGQIQDQGGVWAGTAGGTANALTIAPTPAISAYAAGQRFSFLVASHSTDNATLAVNGLTAKTINGLLRAGQVADVVYDGSVFQVLPSQATQLFRKNVIINGDMRIAQRGTSFAAIGVNAYSLDRWKYATTCTAVHTVTQDTDVPSVAQAGRLFPYSLRLNLTTADTSIAAGDYCLLQQIIEGHNFLPIAQRVFTISFWVKATATGAYCVGLRNSGGDRSYVGTFTINASATWEYKTVTVAASPSAGSWNYTNGTGLIVSFVLAAGSTYHTTAGAWQAGNFYASSAQVNGVNTGATDFRITGVQDECGPVATDFEMLAFQQQLALCQRHYWKTFPYGTAPAQNSGDLSGVRYVSLLAAANLYDIQLVYPVAMRTAGTVTFYNPSAANTKWRNAGLGADSGTPAVVAQNDTMLSIRNPQVAGDGVGQGMAVHLQVDAEL